MLTHLNSDVRIESNLAPRHEGEGLVTKCCQEIKYVDRFSYQREELKLGILPFWGSSRQPRTCDHVS